MNTKQTIYSRYQYSIGDIPSSEIFNEYDNMFESAYDERNVQIGGVGVAIAVDSKEAILLVYSLEAEAFLKLKFSNRKDVKINRYY